MKCNFCGKEKTKAWFKVDVVFVDNDLDAVEDDDTFIYCNECSFMVIDFLYKSRKYKNNE